MYKKKVVHGDFGTMLVEEKVLDPYEMLLEFESGFDRKINQPITPELAKLRWSLIREEGNEVSEELCPAWIPSRTLDKKNLTKELADLMYVVIGTAVTFGLPLREVFEEVHKSNMSKLGEDGKPVLREDGKILKGPNYKEPNLDQFF